DEFLVRLPDVDRGRPALGRAPVALEHAVHEPAELALQRGDLTEGLEPNECCHLNLLARTCLQQQDKTLARSCQVSHARLSAVFPIKDNVPTRTTPVVTWGLIAANVAVWTWEITGTPV